VLLKLSSKKYNLRYYSTIDNIRIISVQNKNREMAEYLTNTIKPTEYSDGKPPFDDPCCQTQPVSALCG
jgi:hypothetical protein